MHVKHCFCLPSISKIADAGMLGHCHELKVSDALYHIICFSGQSSGLFPVSDAYSERVLCRASVQPWNADVQGYRIAYEFACFARQAGFVLMYLMFLHNVLQCSTHGMCYLHIGGLIIKNVGQIVLSAVQGIILFPSGKGGNSSAEACLVF